MTRATGNDESFMRRALALAKRGYGATSPNPMVGAVLVKGGRSHRARLASSRG